MKNSQHRLLQKRNKLFEMKKRGIQAVNWKLDEESRDYLSKYFPVFPDLYRVETRKYYNTAGFPRILKTLNYDARRGKSYVEIHLNKKEKQILDAANIYNKPFRYNIILADS